MKIDVVPTLYNTYALLVLDGEKVATIELHPTKGTRLHTLSDAEEAKELLEKGKERTKMEIFDTLISTGNFEKFSRIHGDIAAEYAKTLLDGTLTEFLRLKQALMLKIVMATDFVLTDSEVFVLQELFEEYGIEGVL